MTKPTLAPASNAHTTSRFNMERIDLPMQDNALPKSLQGPDGRCVRFRHGETNNGRPSRLYVAWLRMRGRCFDASFNQYENYGGRGITVCERWLTFENFRDDMGAPLEGMSLDRIDNDRNYEPGNCRWATRRQQCRNKGNNRMVPYGGVLVPMSEAAELSGIGYNALRGRVDRGIVDEVELYAPSKRSAGGTRKLTLEQVRKIQIDTRALREIAADYGVSKSCIGAVKAGATWKH